MNIKYKGQNWKVKDARVFMEFDCAGLDADGDPINELEGTRWVKPSELDGIKNKLKKQYSSVVPLYGRERLLLFREERNNGKSAKKIKLVRMQREFNDGRWSKADPIKDATDETEKSTWMTWKKVLIPTTIAAILAFIVWLIWG